MHFLNPVVLVGLVAAFVPLVIHLLHRGSARPLPFSNLLFLRRLHHSRMRRVRLRQWLVLLLRMLIVALLIFAFARPTYQTGSGWGGGTTPVAAVVLLDRSFSTGYRVPGGSSSFAQLRQQALELLELFTRRDQILVAPFDLAPYPLDQQPDSQERLRERLSELLPGEAATDLQPALQTAAQFLDARPEWERELFLFTDLARHNWPALENQQTRFADVRVYIGAPDLPERSNLHVDEVAALSWMPAVGKKIPLQVSLTNSAAREASGISLDLFVDAERVHHRQVELRPGEQAQVELAVTPRRAGRLSGYVELENDALTLDNRRYFTLDVPARLDVLLLGDRPADTYYPRRALAAASQADLVLAVRSGLFAELDAALLQGIDVLLLCNLQRLNSAQTALIQDFVATGGGLLLIPGPRADLNFYNRDLLPGLLPAAIKGVVGGRQDQTTFQHLDRERPYHPLFGELLDQQREDQARFSSFFELTPREGLQSLAYFTDGRIALAEGWKAQGRTVLLTSPLALEWNDLPLTGLFVPLLHRLVRELSLPADRHREYLVGQPIDRYLKGIPASAAVYAESPSGSRLRLEAELIGGQYRWKIPRVGESGIWRLWQEGQEVDRFAVNVDTRESVLTPVSEERVLEIFGAERTHFIRPGDDLRLQVLGNRYGRELWRELLALALALLLLELWISRAPRDQSGDLPKTRS